MKPTFAELATFAIAGVILFTLGCSISDNVPTVDLHEVKTTTPRLDALDILNDRLHNATTPEEVAKIQADIRQIREYRKDGQK